MFMNLSFYLYPVDYLKYLSTKGTLEFRNNTSKIDVKSSCYVSSLTLDTF